MKTPLTFRLACHFAALASLASALAHADTLNSNLQGWVDSNGTGNGAGNGMNTFTGNEFGLRFNSWANFDLGSLSGTVTSAKLEVTTVNFPFGDPSVYALGVYDVSTPLGSFIAQTSGVAGYTDLGSGNLYASDSFGDGATITLTLSAQAVSDINAALGGDFRVGFSNITLNGADPNGVDVGTYPNGNTFDRPILILDFGASVPDSGPSLELLALSVVGVSLANRRASRVVSL